MLAAPVLPAVCRLVNQRSSSGAYPAARSSPNSFPLKCSALKWHRMCSVSGSIRPALTRASNSATPSSSRAGSTAMSCRKAGIPDGSPAPWSSQVPPARAARSPHSPALMHTGCSWACETRCIQSTRRLSPSGRGDGSTTTAPAPSDRVQRRNPVSGVSAGRVSRERLTSSEPAATAT